MQGEIESARQQARVEADAEQQRLLGEVESARRQADVEAEGERVRLQGEIAAARQQAGVEAEAERLRHQAELDALRQRTQTEIAAAKQAAATAAATAAASVASGAKPAAVASAGGSPAAFEQMLAATREIDGASTLSQALESLLKHAGAAAGRAAIFLINGDRLKAWKAAAIPDVDVQTVESSIGGKDLLARAIQAGQATASGAGAARAAVRAACRPIARGWPCR